MERLACGSAITVGLRDTASWQVPSALGAHVGEGRAEWLVRAQGRKANDKIRKFEEFFGSSFACVSHIAYVLYLFR